MKRWIALLLGLALLLGGCARGGGPHQVTYLNVFDTVTTLVSYGMTQGEFDTAAGEIYGKLYAYHRLFDIYHDYEGINNLKTVNDMAGVAPVKVEEAVIRLLEDCKAYYALTQGRVNVAMGSVLRLWHDAREQSLQDAAKAYVPAAEQLQAAAEHCRIDSVIIDREASTVYLADPETSLDVGAIAKGWACQQVAQEAPAGMLISVGGNVCITGAKDDAGTAWTIGVQDPDRADAYLKTIRATGGAVVTSGDYQRVFTVDGRQYHHIIDPQTGMPGGYWRSVTVVCEDSGLADALSTALFLLPLEQGKALAAQCGVEVLWLDAQGRQYMTDGMEALLAQ